ncbi:MAG: hypothetical protein IJ398_03270 [Clostridia bacterium]|nr:hypothetical protein [Clostridia bacterium]
MKKSRILKIRMSEDVAKRLAYVSKSEGMTLQNQIMSMIRQKIQYFERVKGNIKPSALETVDMNEFENEEI